MSNPRTSNPRMSNAKMSNRVLTQLVQFQVLKRSVNLTGIEHKTLLGEQFFLWKEGEVLIFATHTNICLLAEATTIYADGTFEICPRLFIKSSPSMPSSMDNSSHLCMANQEIYTTSSSLVQKKKPWTMVNTSLQKKSWQTLSSPLYRHLRLSFQVLVSMAATFISHNVYREKCRDWWRSTKSMNYF